ncbi:hypothetical protein DFH07DRAFT_241274 [Mycena maculata]|uniref:Uncharacterized protein n=1 Tax=Mycena maculata TaxID=230809 RepID=A0AAD7JSQ4_9AGAR|nr:hypothetical protein DFH07DRAFT_241274 [Mycena maculata]
MPGATEATGPSYISSHSADLILSDIRPIKLKLEALRSINVLLDEFLFNILNTARSLSTDKLRASLLSILPTSLGKEALLEAEVELRAYWDRTARPVVPEDDTQTFNLQWAFELLRLKCEAYSTLNESDEDSAAVGLLQERMTQLGGTIPPTPALVAPASLYLTAILESMCEHILSNVGRVAARDSSRTGATVQDVFVALCEDHSIYALFKSMRVYQQIELLSKTPKPRRSKSFSRSDRPSISRTSPSNQDLPSSGREHRPRGSTDTSATAATSATATTMPVVAASSSRSSFDKTRMKKLMSGSRNSSEREGDSQNSHKRSESVLSEDTKQTLAAYNQNEEPQDTAMLTEFDNLMRSDLTMKVSLTPDRLKTMEVYKQEKDQRGNRRPAPLAFSKSEPESSSNPPSRANGRRPSLRHVNSIVEDEEESPSASAPTPRRNITSPPNLPSASTTSVSSTSSSRVVPRQSSRSNLASPPSETSPPLPMSYPKRGPSGPAGFDADAFPVKTRRIQKNRESLDLDAVMAGSDDEDDEPAASPAPRTPSTPRTPSKPAAAPKRPPVVAPRQSSSPPAVSASTRELMNFLNEGPPDVPKVSASGREMMDFLAQGPPDNGTISSNGVSTIEGGKKSSGRLQRMMSKLAMGTSEKSRSQPSEDFGRGNKGLPPTTPVRTTPGQGLPHQTSYGNLSSLANRPVPPRPPPVQPISPPASPSDEEYQSSTRSRKASVTQSGTPRRVLPTWEQQMADGQAAPAVPLKTDNAENGSVNGSANGASVNGSGNGHSRSANGHAKNGVVVDEQARSSSRKPSAGVPAAAPEASKREPAKPAIQTQQLASPTSRSAKTTPVVAAAPAPPPIAEDDARDMRRLLARATNADECRLLFDMFLAKSGVPLEPATYDVPYPSPVLSDAPASRESAEVALELALVELFLGGSEVVPPPKKKRSKKRSEASPAAAPAPAPTGDLPAELRKYVAVAPVETPATSSRTVSEVGA